MEFNLSVKTGSLRNIFKRSTGFASPLTDPTQILLQAFGTSTGNQTGIAVTDATALRYTSYYRAVNLISDALATLNWNVFKDVNGSTKKDLANPISKLMRGRPSRIHNAEQWRKIMAVYALMRGNAIAHIVTNSTGQPIELMPIHPDRYQNVRVVNGEKYYDIQGFAKPLHADEVLHIMGLSLNGLIGISPIQYHATNIGLGLQHLNHQAKYFKDGYYANFYLQTPTPLQEGRPKALSDEFVKNFGGTKNPPVLHSGMDLKNLSISQSDAQALEHAKFNIENIAQAFNLPVHKLMQIDKPSYNSLEQQNIEYAQECLLPWIKRFELEIDDKLLGQSETHWLKINVNELLRGDLKTRWETYRIALSNSVLNPNEVRELEEMDKRPDGQGDEYQVQKNVTTSSEMELQLEKLQAEIDALKQERAHKLNGKEHSFV